MENPNVTILLATYNGIAFLEKQLQSFASQSFANIDILVSDDGSSDGTIELLNIWKSKWTKGSFQILDGPKKGFSENFRSLIIALENKKSYVAFSDQDDIWHKDKLEHAVNKLLGMGVGIKSMYCSRSRLVGSDGKLLDYSPLFTKLPSFGNALVQSLAGGNTIVLNCDAFNIVRKTAERVSFFSHDWWCYQVIMGVGGQVFYDPVPQIDYRQHENNIFGRNRGIRAIWTRIIGLFSGEFSKWITANLTALECCHDLLNREKINLVLEFQRVRKSSGIKCVLFLWRNDIKRQTTMANIALYITALIGRL